MAKKKRSRSASPDQAASKALWNRKAGDQFANRPLLRETDSTIDRVELTEEFSDDTATAAMLRAAAFAETRSAAASGRDFSAPTAPSAGSPNWIQLGPLIIPKGQTNGSARVNVSGRVTSIAIDPGNPGILYLGTAQGGVWKTVDGGVNWSPMTDNEASLAIGALVLDPNNSQILYAGTGEGNFSQDSYYGVGVLKSTDGGVSWALQAASTFAGGRFCEFAIHASNSARILAATTRGLYRSSDSGSSWIRLTSGLPPTAPATDVAFDTSDGNVAYAAFYSNGIYRTTNAGASSPAWTRLTGGLPTTQLGRIVIAVSPSSPTTVFALMGNSSTDLIDRFYVSTDRGVSWTRIAIPSGNIGGQSFYNIHLTVDPTTPDVVYLCGVSLYKAVRSGSTWTITEIGRNIHADNHYTAIHPSKPLVVYAGNDGGIYKSEDGGATWDDSINSGLCITQFEFIDDHPSSGASVFGGTQDNGTEHFRNHPVFWHADDGDGGCCLINDNNPTNVLSTYYSASPKLSTAGGKFGTWLRRWNGIAGDGLFYPPLVSCQTDPFRVAIGTDRINLDNSQGGDGWPIKVPSGGGLGEVSAIAYVTPDLLYAGNTSGVVFRIAGTTSTTISQAPLPSSYIWDIAAVPGAPAEVILVMSGFGIPHVWRGVVPATGPAAWTSISSNLPDIPVNALVIDGQDADIMYVGTDIGVFRTNNRGVSWELYSNGLPNCAMYDMKLNEATRVLRGATHGRGLWEIQTDVRATAPVDLYVRDHPMDTARIFPTPDAASAWEDRFQQIGLGTSLFWWMSVDIKVDALEGAPPAYQMPTADVDYVRFEVRLEHRNPLRGRVNRLYVQVHNRGFRSAEEVRVKALCADLSAGLPNLPPDFWTAFPGDSADVSQWRPVGSAQMIPKFPPGTPLILEWDWTPPVTSSSRWAILVVIDSVSDPIPDANKVFVIADLVPNEKRVALKNIQLVGLADESVSPMLFTAGSFKKQVIRVVPGHPDAPKVQLTLAAAGAASGVTVKSGFRKASLTQAGARRAAAAVPGFTATEVLTLAGGVEGEIELKIPKKGLEAVIEVGPARSPGGFPSFHVIQYEGDKVVGGSTFVVRGQLQPDESED